MERRLFVEPVVRRFASSKESDFRTALEEAEGHAVFGPLYAPKEVLLGPDGATASGYRFTSLALYQLCHVACPGLYRFLLELAGAHRTDDEPQSDFSFEEAVDTLNRTVRRRFPTRLSGMQLLRDAKSKRVEGLVGPKYRRLPNLELYSRARDAAPDVEFYEGWLSGRWMLFRLYRPRPVFVAGDPDADRFYGGYHFSNNEVGKGSVKAAPFLLRSHGRTCALAASVSGASLRHQGDTFGIKLVKLLEGSFSRKSDPDVYLRGVERLRGLPLGLGLADADREEIRRQDLVHFLTRHRLRPGLAVRTVGSMLAQGSYDVDRSPLREMDRSTLASRDAFDLFNAIGREAKRMPIGVREHAEQVAHSLLTGKINIPPASRSV